ncbi:MAG: terminase small subunit [Rickettsiales bacterium]
MDKEIKLNTKRKRFVEEYVIDLNGTQAAIRAGYSKKTARITASKLLAKANIQEAIAKLQNKISNKLEISAERVLKEYSRLAFLDIRKIFNDDGSLKSVHEIDDDTIAAISGLEVESLFDNEGGNKSKIGSLHKIKLSDKRAALDSIARHLGMFNDKLDVTAKVDSINHDVDWSDSEKAARAYKELMKSL